MTYRQGKMPFNGAVQPVQGPQWFIEEFARGAGDTFVTIPNQGFQGPPERWLPWNPLDLAAFAYFDLQRRAGVTTVAPPAAIPDAPAYGWAGMVCELTSDMGLPSPAADYNVQLYCRTGFMTAPSPLNDASGEPENWDGFGGIILSGANLAEGDGAFIAIGARNRKTSGSQHSPEVWASISKWADSQTLVEQEYAPLSPQLLYWRVLLSYQQGPDLTEVLAWCSVDAMTWVLLIDEAMPFEGPVRSIGCASSGYTEESASASVPGSSCTDFVRISNLVDDPASGLKTVGGINYPG